MQTSATTIAFEALIAAVDRAQASDALATVTVICPNRASAVDARRAVARSAHGGRGSLAVTTTTLADLASDLVARSGESAGRRPLTISARQSAIRAALRTAPGLFDRVANEPVTIRALARASTQLDGALGVSLDNAVGLTAEVVRVHRLAMSTLGNSWLTPDAALTIARRFVADPASRQRLGVIILFGLDSPHPAAEQLLLGDILGTASAVGDDFSGSVVDIPLSVAITNLDSPTVISVSDADEEARAVARSIVALVRTGVPGNRIGVFWGAAETYLTLLHAHLADAGITVAGPGARTLADSSLGRALLRLVALNPDDLDPLAVLGVLADGALRWSVKPLPSSAEAERITARDRVEEPAETHSGVFFGNTESDDVVEESGADSDANAKQRRSWQRQTLWDEYLTALGASVRALHHCTTWAKAAVAIHNLIDEHLSAPASGENGETVLAREHIEKIVSELVWLDEIEGGAPTAAGIRASLEVLFVDARARQGRHGTGVSLGSFASGVGRDLDHVFAVGLAEGITPSRARDDALLPDEVRSGWGLPTLSERAAIARGRFVGTLSSARETTTVFVPRGDLRSGGERQRSRWLGGLVPDDADMTVVRSHHEAMLTGAPAVSSVPATAEGWRIRNNQSGGQWQGVSDVEFVGSSRSMRRDRALGRFTRFTGNLAEVRELIPFTHAPIAATQLEEWVASPLFFLVRHVLGVRPLDLQVEDFEPSALDRGNIQHAALESFTRVVLADENHTASLTLLHETTLRVFTTLARTSWIRHLWQRDQRRITRQLDQWWRREVQTERWAPESAEQPFGLGMKESLEAIPFDLDDGSTIRFRGKVDRIDRGVLGVTVVDYKGRRPAKLTLSADNPTGSGQKYQLAVYGLFAASLRGADESEAPVRTEYDYLASPDDPVLGFTMTSESVEVLRSDVSAVVRAIRAGVFPARPARGALERFTALAGESDLTRLWEQLRVSPELAPYSRFFIDDRDEATP
jgi:RecB family exonuclease